MKIKKVLVVASTSFLCFHSVFFPVISTSTPIFAIEQSTALPKEPELLDSLENTTETQAPTFSFEENQESYTAGQQFFLVVHVSQEVSEFVMDLPKGVSIVEEQQSTDIQFTNIEGNQWQVKANSPQVTFSIPLILEEAGEYEVAIGESKTMLHIQREEIQQTTEPETISSQEEELEKNEKSNGDDEANTKQEIENERINATRNGTWGTVSWSWLPATRTITLQGGDAGSVNSSPWRTHTDVVRIIVEGRVVLPENSGWLFWELPYLESIENAGGFDTSNVTRMDSMFRNASSLATLDVSIWDTRNVTRMEAMFWGASSLTTLDVSAWNTQNVTDMGSMFRNVSSLEALDVTNWNTTNVNNMDSMFNAASSLTTLDVSTWDTRNVTRMDIMFNDASSLATLDVSTWDTRNVTRMDRMFRGASSLTTLDVSTWDTRNVTRMDIMFNDASSLATLDVSTWDTRNVTRMNGMFWGASSLPTLNVSAWDTRNVTRMDSMFRGASSLATLDVSAWDTRNVTRMEAMFWGASSLTTLDVSAWNTQNVTDMGSMFRNVSSLEALDVTNWNTTNVNNMDSMFNAASSLTTLDVSAWDTRNVTRMDSMFRGASSLTTLDVSAWDTRNVTDMRSMFRETSGLNVLDLSEWNTMGISSANDMFTGVTNLSTLYIGTRSRFDHLASPPTMPNITSSDNYTGSWVYYLNQANTIPEAYITSSSSDFWREYDGTHPGTYQWQTTGAVVVHYRDLNDQEIIASEIITGGIREPFQIEAKAMEGYTFKEVTGNTSGRFTEEEQVVIFRYMKDKVDPLDPLNPEMEVVPENKPDLPEDQGLLSIDFVSQFNFGIQRISVSDQTYYAKPQRLLHEDGTVNEAEERPNFVQISDRRPDDERNGWQLSVTQNGQFSNQNGHELIGSEIQLFNQELVTAQGGTMPELQEKPVQRILPNTKKVLLQADKESGTGTWIYRFGDQNTADKSIGLYVPKGTNPEATSYSTKLTWELSSVPDN